MLTIKTTGLEDYLDPAGGGAYVQALLIGGHGVGKTPFAGKFPKPIFAMCEHGTMSIAKDRLPYAEIYSDTDMDAFVAAVKRDSVLPLAKRQYLTVVVDTIDAYQKRLMDHRVVSQGLDRFTGWDNWDWLDSKVSGALRQLSQLPVHLVVTMHYRDITIGEGDEKSLAKEAKLKGDLKTSIYQEFDLIGFMETYYAMGAAERVRKHRIRWWPEPGFDMVRDRSNTLPQFTPVDFQPSDFQTIFDHLVSGVDDLQQQTVVEEVAVEGESADTGELPAPDEGAGPVPEPSLPAAKRDEEPKKKKQAPIAKIKEYVGTDVSRAEAGLRAEMEYPEADRRKTLITWLEGVRDASGKADDTDAPAPASEAPPEQTAPAPDPTPPPSLAPPPVENEFGTPQEPLIISRDVLNGMDGPKYAPLVHVHDPDGSCLKGSKICEVEAASPEVDDALPIDDPDADPTAASEPESEPEPEREGFASEPVVEDPPEESAPESPEPAAAAPPDAGGAPNGIVDENQCGFQPEALRGLHDPKPGCGRSLTADNKAPLAVVKFKTKLCTECFAHHNAA